MTHSLGVASLRCYKGLSPVGTVPAKP